MSAAVTKLLIAPVDGSPQTLKALDYVGRFFETGAAIKVQLLFVIPPLPPLLVQESKQDRNTAKMLEKMEKKHEETANSAMEQGRRRLLTLGFDEDQILTVVHRKAAGVARGICALAEKHTADAIVMSTRGRGRMESFFLGSTATKVADASALCPVWLVKGEVTDHGVIIGVDPSECALRAVDHAGFMLTGLEHPVTLYYSRRNLLRFAPKEVVQAAPDLEDVWQNKIGKHIAPVMEKARQMLLDAGMDQSRIRIKVAEGSRSAGADLVKAAQDNSCGTIIMGRHGEAGHNAFAMGSVTRTVVRENKNMAVWIVP